MLLRNWIIIILSLSCLILFSSCSCNDDDDDSSSVTDDDDDDDTINDDDDDDDDDDIIPNPPEFFEDHHFLSDISLWYGHVVNANRPKPRKIGEFGVGNGRVFALVGTTLPYHTLRNIIGPDYERDPMFFSDKQFQLISNDENIFIDQQWDLRVRKTPITLTRSLYKNQIEMFTIDFAPKGGDQYDDMSERALIRIFILRNNGSEEISGLSLKMNSPLGKTENGVHKESVDYKHLSVRPADGGFPEKSLNSIQLPDIAPGQEIVSTLLMAFTFDGELADDVFDSITGTTVANLLDETYEWWKDWYDEGALLITPNQKFNDLLESLQVTIKVQQAHTGAMCVMSEYTRTWIRDTMGPARLYAPLGRTKDFKQMLDYYYLAALVRGDIGNSMSGVIEVDPWPDPPDWESMGTMSGRLAGEAPSYLPLQYGYYYDYTGDTDILEERYGMLKHALAHQDFYNDCLLPFSGDETFREIMSITFGNMLGTTLYQDLWLSSNSSFLFAAAADRMAQISSLLGKTADETWFTEKASEVRQCTEDYYWLDQEGYYAAMIDINTFEPIAAPYEDVNTKPLWIEAESPDDQHQVDQILGVINAIGIEPGVIQSPIHPMYQWLLARLGITKGTMSGMTQGYFLDNLARIDHPDAEAAFNIWKVHCNDSGNVGEAMLRDDYSRFMYLLEPFGFVSDLTSRYRPWEGGIYAGAMLYYITGFKADYPNRKVWFAPHMPDGWDEVDFNDIPFGPHTLDTKVTDTGTERTFILSNGNGEFDLYIKFSAPKEIHTLMINDTVADLNDHVTEYQWGRGRVRIGPVSILPSQKFEIKIGY